MRPLVLRHSLRAEVHAREHERAQREHRLPHLRRLADVVHALGGLDDVVHETIDPRGSGDPEDGDLLVRKVGFAEKPVAQSVVDVVVDVRDAIDEPDDLAFERRRFALSRMGEDPVAHLVREVERPRDPERLLVVAEPPAAVS